MGCESYTLKGIKRGCEANIGGIKVVYIAPIQDVSAFTYDSGTTEVTGITMVSGKKFKEYNFRKNTGSLTKTLNVTDEGGNYVSSELSLRFSRMETEKRIEIRALSLNEMVVIVKDANDKYWVLGDPAKDEPVTASAGGGETGTNREDSNAYTITLSCESAEWPYEVKSTAITSEIIDFNA